MRKAEGVRPAFSASGLCLGAETHIFGHWVISVTAVSNLFLMLLYAVASFVLLSKGRARSLPAGYFTHSLTRLRSMWSKAAVGCTAWTMGMGAQVNLSMGSRRGPLVEEGMAFRSAAASRRAMRSLGEVAGLIFGKGVRVIGMFPSERERVSGLERLGVARSVGGRE